MSGMGAGYLVLALDYFEGDSYGFHLDEKGFDVQAWVKAKQARTEVLLPPWIDAVRQQHGDSGNALCLHVDELTKGITTGSDKKYVCVGI